MATPEIKYSESYNATAQNVSTSVELVLRYDTATSLSTVQSDVKAWINSGHLRDFQGRILSSYDITADESSLGNIWNAKLTYSTRQRKQNNESQQYPTLPGCVPESFSSTGGTAHIVNAISETGYHREEDEDAPSMYGGINWNGERFEGIDIHAPAFEFTLQRTYDYDLVTPAVKTMWANASGSVNSDLFWGYAAGTCLFLGVSGSSRTVYEGDTEIVEGVIYQTPSNYFDITYHFQCQPNRPSYEIGGITVSKSGWQYVWLLNEITESDNRTIERPLCAYVDTVYPSISFANIIL